MHHFHRVLSMSIGTGAQLAAITLTMLGIVSVIIGISIMPTLRLSEPQFYLGLLGLMVFMVVCFSAGQVAIIRDRLTRRCS